MRERVVGAEHTVLYSEAGRNCVTGRKGEYSETDIQGNSVTQSAIAIRPVKKRNNFLSTVRVWAILYEGFLYIYPDHKAEKPEVLLTYKISYF